MEKDLIKKLRKLSIVNFIFLFDLILDNRAFEWLLKTVKALPKVRLGFLNIEGHLISIGS